MSIPHFDRTGKRKYKGRSPFQALASQESPTQKPGGTNTSYLATVRKFVKDEGDQMDGYNAWAATVPPGT